MKILFCSFNKYKKISGEYINLLRYVKFVEDELGYQMEVYLPFSQKGLWGYTITMPGYINKLRKAVKIYDKVQVFLPSSAFLWMYYVIFAGIKQREKIIFYIDGLYVEDDFSVILHQKNIFYQVVAK